jgi:hypothetical protein
MNIPYTTKTGLQIGIMYKPKQYVELDKDMLLLQEALLTNNDYIKLKKFKDIAIMFIILFSLFGYFIFK